MYQDAVSRAKQLGDHLLEGIVLNDWGQAIERPDRALPLYEQSLAIAKAEGDERLVTAASLNVANKQDNLGKHEEALATYDDVIALATRLHDAENLAIASMNKGDTLIKLDRYKEALPLAAAARASFEERGDEDGVGYSYITSGDAHLGLAEMAEARKDFEAALALRVKLGEEHTIGATQHRLATLELEEGHPEAAEAHAQAAVAQYRKEDRPEQLAWGLRTLAHIEIELGKKAEAAAAVDEAEKQDRPDPATPDASEIAMVRGIADPAHADAQLAIIHTVEAAPRCLECDLFGHLHEGELEAGLGHAPRARALLSDVERRAKAHHADNVAARAAVLLGKL